MGDAEDVTDWTAWLARAPRSKVVDLATQQRPQPQHSRTQSAAPQPQRPRAQNVAPRSALPLSDPVLVECGVSAANVQCPSEGWMEEWRAVPSGGFKRMEARLAMEIS